MRISSTSLLGYNNKQFSLNNRKNTSFKSYQNYNKAFNELWNAKFLKEQPEKNSKLFDMLSKLFKELIIEKQIGIFRKFVPNNEFLYYKLTTCYRRAVEKRSLRIISEPFIVTFLEEWNYHKLSCESEKGKTIFMADSKPGVYHYTIKSKNSFHQDPITKTKPLRAFCFSSLDEDDDRMIILSTPYHGHFALTRGRLTKKSTNDLCEHPFTLAELDKNLKLNIDDGLIEFVTDTDSNYNTDPNNKLRIKAKGNRGFLCKTRYEVYDYDLKANLKPICKLDYDYWPKIVYDDDIPEITNKNLLNSENILKPEQIRNLEYGKDYALLVVQKDSKYADLGTGIMPYSYSDEWKKDWGYNERNRLLGSTFDSEKLYFTPLVPNSNYKINDDDIIIAVKRENVVVLNKKLRDREFILDPAQKKEYERTSNFTPYLTNTYTLNEANKLLLENKEGFSPETVMGIASISKKDFITPEDARKIISKEKGYSFDDNDRKIWNRQEFIDNSYRVENDVLNNGRAFECSKDINENKTLANALRSLIKLDK